jgi:inorganic pyrophosphatase
MKLPEPFSEQSDHLNAIIETPKGSRNKYVFDPATSLFKLNRALPAGMFFPIDFGFIPGTLAEDGDPLDVLVFMEGPAYPGCLVECRVLGIMEIEQSKEGKMVRNDRVLAVAAESKMYADLKSKDDIGEELLKDVVYFFKTYHERRGEKFSLLKIAGSGKAIELIRQQSGYENHRV